MEGVRNFPLYPCNNLPSSLAVDPIDQNKLGRLLLTFEVSNVTYNWLTGF